MTNLIRMAARRLRRRASRPAQGDILFTGDYSSWAEAERDSGGYDAPVILARTRDALLKVKRGEAVYERDSVLFDRPQHSFPLLAGLLRGALLDGGRVRVADYGGSLGSSYFQCRRFLGASIRFEWCVIEQPAHVRCGREHFEDRELRFYETIEQCFQQHQLQVLLLSSVLQYLPAPYATLERLLAYGLPDVIIDRTPFLQSDRDRLTIQTVPEWIYPATYPAWFFSETRFTRAIAAAGYVLVTDFTGADRVSPEDETAYFKGFIYEHAGARHGAR